MADDGAQPYAPGGSGGGSKGPPHPEKVVASILRAEHLVEDPTGAVFRWNGMFWAELGKPALSKLIFAHDQQHFKIKRRDEITALLRVKIHDSDFQWGSVLDGSVAVRNGVVDLATAVVRPHAPADYLEWAVPFNYNPKASCDVWAQACIDWFGEDENGAACIANLQEFFGYILMSHARYQTACMLIGPSNTGKSRVVAAAQALVGGVGHFCSLSVESMDDPSRLVQIVGAALNVITELPANAMIKDSGFKKLVSGEPVEIDEKYRKQFTYISTAKHLIATNHPPRLTDRTEAMFNRLLPIPMTHVFYKEDQDPDLDDKIAGEMEGVLAWSLEGAMRLYRNKGIWSPSERSTLWLNKYRKDSNPFVAFMDETLYELDTGAVPLSALADRYNKWNRGSRNEDVRAIGRKAREAGLVTKAVRVDLGSGPKVPKMCIIGYSMHNWAAGELVSVNVARDAKFDHRDEIEEVQHRSAGGDDDMG